MSCSDEGSGEGTRDTGQSPPHSIQSPPPPWELRQSLSSPAVLRHQLCLCWGLLGNRWGHCGGDAEPPGGEGRGWGLTERGGQGLPAEDFFVQFLRLLVLVLFQVG